MKILNSLKPLLLLVMIFSFYSCEEDEFYEKEYIDTVEDEYNRNNPKPSGGIADDGSTTPGDDSTTPGDDSTTPGDESTITLENIRDNFKQNQNNNKLDILWVVDNSGSMSDEQKALGENFDIFIRDFVDKSIDFKMAITTTDPRSSYRGIAWKDSIAKLTTTKLNGDKVQFLENFANLINVGTRGSGNEQGIQASSSFSENYRQTFFRDDAYFIIVYVSDEEDQSPGEVSAHLANIQGIKNNNGLIRAYSIVNMTQKSAPGYAFYDYQRYKEISESTNGKVADINSDFHTTLQGMGEQIAALTEQFPLSAKPYEENSIKVFVNGVENSSWKYLASSNSIKFDVGFLPSSGSSIKVEYSSEK